MEHSVSDKIIEIENILVIVRLRDEVGPDKKDMGMLIKGYIWDPCDHGMLLDLGCGVIDTKLHFSQRLLSGELAPQQTAVVVRLGCPLLLGIHQHWLQPSPTAGPFPRPLAAH